MEWNDNCHHGIKWQDDQHKQLFDKINSLYQDIILGSADEESFSATISFLETYSREHFNLEEFYMKKHGYPRMENHLKEHQCFTDDLNAILSEGEFKGIESAVELMNQLNNWFYDHTQTTDKYLAQFLIKYEK